jgi:hypothetical protein
VAVGESFALRHHHEQGDAPGRDCPGTPAGGRQLRTELIVVEGANLGASVDSEVPVRDRGLPRDHRDLRHRR